MEYVLLETKRLTVHDSSKCSLPYVKRVCYRDYVNEKFNVK